MTCMFFSNRDFAKYLDGVKYVRKACPMNQFCKAQIENIISSAGDQLDINVDTECANITDTEQNLINVNQKCSPTMSVCIF